MRITDSNVPLVTDTPDDHSIRVTRTNRDAFISDRDPGDETYVLVGEALPRSEPVELSEAAVVPVPAIVTARSYKATYRCGDKYMTRTVMGFDSFPASAALAQASCVGEWQLISLEELI